MSDAGEVIADLVAFLSSRCGWARVWAENHSDRFEISVWKDSSSDRELGWGFVVMKNDSPDKLSKAYVCRVLESPDMATCETQRLRLWDVKTKEERRCKEFEVA